MVFDISETDHNARRQNQVTMAAANVIKWKRIQLTNDEAGIENKEKVFWEKGCMEIYKENQARRGKKNVNQIMETIRILKVFAYERMTME